jgi:membrane associated rhomboid family serine protease
MIPLRDNNPTRSFPTVTVALIVANVIVFMVQKAAGPFFDATYSMVPADVVSGQDYVGIVHVTAVGLHFMHLQPGALPANLGPNDIYLAQPPHPSWLTIFSSMFMHANLLHIGGNMLFLWIFGNNVEDALGKMRFLLFYMVCGLIAAIAQIATNPFSLVPTLGASGAIAGVLGAYLIMFPGARVLTLIFLGFFAFLREIPAFWVIGLWIVLQVIEGVGGLGGMATGGVAYFAHIGGFIAGLVLIMLFGGPSLGNKDSYRRFSDYNNY